MGLYDPPSTSLDPRILSAYGAMHRSLGLGGTVVIIEGVCNALGVSQFRLAYLLGIEPSNLYRWFAGRNGVSPGAISLARLIQLLLWDKAGVDVSKMQAILWDASLVRWRDGSVTSGDHRQDGPGLVPRINAYQVWAAAEALVVAEAQRRGQKAASDRRHAPRGINPPPFQTSAE